MENVNRIAVQLSAKGKKFAMVVSRYNEFISGKLVEGAVDCLLRHGAEEKDVSLIWVPGSFEVPVIAKKLADQGKYDGIICLGAIIRGETPHFNYVAQEAAKGVAKVSMDSGIACSFGVITADTLEQAIDRAGTKSGNKGRDAALVAIEMANLISEL